MRLRGSWGPIFQVLSILVVAPCMLALIAGCGGGDSSAEGSAGPAIPDSAPKLTVPAGLPPEKLVVKDLRKGEGKEAKKNDTVQIHYYGISWGSGSEHSNSFRYSTPPIFKLGDRRLLRGLALAIPGMREGGSREVLIPHNLVYYPDVPHVQVGVLGALIFRVYLVKVLPRT